MRCRSPPKGRRRGFRIERQAVAVAESARALRCWCRIGDPSSSERRCSRPPSGPRTAKMLEYHADAELLWRRWTGDHDRLAIPQDLAGMRFQRTEQHLDQRRLARAVSTEEGMTPWRHEVDVIACREREPKILSPRTSSRFILRQAPHPHCPPHLVFQICSVFISMVGNSVVRLLIAFRSLKELQEFPATASRRPTQGTRTSSPAVLRPSRSVHTSPRPSGHSALVCLDLHDALPDDVEQRGREASRSSCCIVVTNRVGLVANKEPLLCKQRQVEGRDRSRRLPEAYEHAHRSQAVV